MNSGSLKQTTDPGSQMVENPNGCFDCNICLDSSHDPIVTLCGHLYCWRCIYNWLRVSAESHEPPHPKCPVCKSPISTSTIVPLYGRGTLEPEQKKHDLFDSTVPDRPPALQNRFQTHDGTHLRRGYFPHLSAGPSSPGSYSPTINTVGELVFTRMFGSSGPNLFGHPYSNYGHFTGNDSPRRRRREMQLDESLNRVSIFLVCCIVLCLILF